MWVLKMAVNSIGFLTRISKVWKKEYDSASFISETLKDSTKGIAFDLENQFCEIIEEYFKQKLTGILRRGKI